MDYLIINDENLSEILMGMNSGEEMQLTLKAAKENSINIEIIERNTFLENVDFDVLRKRILKIITFGVASLVAINMVFNVKGDLDNPLRMEKMSIELGSMVSEIDSSHIQTILDKNTYRSGEYIVYNQEGIAKDLLTFDSSIFDYALCSVCNDMGNSMNNNVGIHGMSNIDSVIYFLKMYSGMKGKYFNQYVSNVFSNVDNLNDYLVKNGFVDSKGSPSMDAFKSACDSNAKNVYDSIKSQTGNKGAIL